MPRLAIFSLELTCASRRERTYWVRTVYVATLATLVALYWIARCNGTVAWTMQEQVGREIFSAFGWAQFVLLVLAAPITLANSIAEERRRQTLPLLLSTGLSSFEIVMGKFLGGMTTIVILMVAGMPIMFLLLAFGGLSFSQVLLSFYLTLVCSAVCGAIALCTSQFINTPYVSFFVAALIAVGTALMLAVLAGGRPFLSSYSQFRIIMTGRIALPLFWLVSSSIAAAFIILGALIIAAVPLRDSAGDTGGRGRGRWYRLASLLRRRGELAEPSAWEECGNPVRLRESGRYPFLSGLPSASVTGLSAVLLLGAGWACSVNNLHDWAPPVLIALPLFAALSKGAELITREKEANTITVVCVSPLSSEEIIMGKIESAGRQLLPLSLPVAGYAIVFALNGTLPASTPFSLVATLILGGVFVLSCATGAGMFVSRANKAIALAAVAIIVIELLLALLWCIPAALGLTGPPLHATIYWAITSTGDDALQDLAINLALHLACASLLLKASCRWFDRLSGRG